MTDSDIINSNHTKDSVIRNSVMFLDQTVTESTSASITRTTDSLTVPDREHTISVETTQTVSLMDRPDYTCADHIDDSVLQNSRAGHWFLEGWIGDHPVEFLVDSGSSVTAMSDSLYQTLICAGATVGTLGCTSRTLRGANSTRIGVSGCSHCVVSFMGLQTEFPILVCDLVIVFFTVGHCSIPPYSEVVLHCTVQTAGGRPMSSSGLLEGLTLFAKNTGLVVGRTFVDPSRWRIAVLVSNSGQDTVMVEPFSEVGMVAQISAIQSITEPLCRPSCNSESFPTHLHDLLDQTYRDLDSTQQRQLAGVQLQYSDLFPVPGSTLTGHKDAVEHEIDTWDVSPKRCILCWMSHQKMKKEEECVAEMLTGGQIGPSDSPWSAPVVLVTKKDGGTQFGIDYRRLNNALSRTPIPCPALMIPWICWSVNNGFPL